MPKKFPAFFTSVYTTVGVYHLGGNSTQTNTQTVLTFPDGVGIYYLVQVRVECLPDIYYKELEGNSCAVRCCLVNVTPLLLLLPPCPCSLVRLARPPPARALSGVGHLHKEGGHGVAAAARPSGDSGYSLAHLRARVHQLAVSLRTPPYPPIIEAFIEA